MTVNEKGLLHLSCLTTPEPKMAKKCVGITGKNTVTKTIDAD